MKKIYQKVREYLYNTDIDINKRLGDFFIYIGIVAAILGVIVCLWAHEPAFGTICTALIAAGAPLIACVTRHSGHRELYGRLIAGMIIFMIPLVWLTTGVESGGTVFWFLFELFYITLFTRKGEMAVFFTAAVLVQAGAVIVDWMHPEWFFHLTDRRDQFVSIFGSAVVVTVEILFMVIVQKSLYVHEREISTRTRDVTKNFMASIANTIDSKDTYTGGHSRRVAEYASDIARRLGMSQAEVDNIYLIGLLHDIGKIGVPDSILNKPGRLTDEEFAQIRLHPVYGADILKEITMIPHLIDGVRYHHERYDGHGYPDGIAGEDIPFVARMITVADSYDAMSTSRVYRKSIRREEIINEIIRCRGTQFDPYLADVFVEMLMAGYQIREKTDDHATAAHGNDPLSAAEVMHHIIEKNKQNEGRERTALVDNNEFLRMYEYLRNLSLRRGGEILLVSISLDFGGKQENGELRAESMENLNSAITQSIRAVDVCTTDGPNSFLLLLLDAHPNSVGHVMERISRNFYHMQQSTAIGMTYRIIDA